MSIYSERRPDGWPLCPKCGEDELWSAHQRDLSQPLTEEDKRQYEATIVNCLRCGWRPEPETTRHPST